MKLSKQTRVLSLNLQAEEGAVLKLLQSKAIRRGFGGKRTISHKRASDFEEAWSSLENKHIHLTAAVGSKEET